MAGFVSLNKMNPLMALTGTGALNVKGLPNRWLDPTQAIQNHFYPNKGPGSVDVPPRPVNPTSNLSSGTDSSAVGQALSKTLGG